jgi:undecaprenyl-diphosphatase
MQQLSITNEMQIKQKKRLIYFAITAILFIVLTAIVKIHGSGFFHFNQTVFDDLQSIRTQSFDMFALIICLLGDKHVVMLTIGILFLWLLWEKQPRLACYMVALLFMTILIVHFCKQWTASPRPGNMSVALGNFSYPSGHATMSIILMSFIYNIATPSITSCSKKYIFALVMLVLLVLIGFMRLYLGAHWVTDVLGGWLLGLSCVFLISWMLFRQPPVGVNTSRLMLVFLVSYLAMMAVYGITYRQQLILSYVGKVSQNQGQLISPLFGA